MADYVWVWDIHEAAEPDIVILTKWYGLLNGYGQIIR
jgi:hypothetical protein